MTLLNSFQADDIRDRLAGKSVLVTGGTGSFGKQFVRTVLGLDCVKRLIVLSRDEQKHFDMMREFDDRKYPAIRYFLGDVRDLERLQMAFRNVDIVVHAAAQKHVPLAEYNPTECLRTNVWGAENVVRAALDNGVETVMALSTDKAVNPVNLYGASKLAAEKVFIAANNLSGQGQTRFGAVRYGNVVGSRGSVVPFFRNLIRQNADALPITDDRMTRFWITLQQGVNFVLSSMCMMKGGEIFIPKIPSMKMTDLAHAMAPDMPIKIVGIRPGEKLHEVMVNEEEARTTRELADRYVIHPMLSYWAGGDQPEGEPVPEDFRYASNTNTWWLPEPELLGMISRLDMDL
ncbi:UDP-N-acetylglucosamine 4,6-dehydratase (inverting) [Magnetospirillum sp. SS-4]|uniref:UDP-N-acetylglucosamine 4,6-dehydratase (inverting) n=1 Tax=Magnetospirillum sp. SS-4 TaxID=2681465 RepID=UPI0013833440|nr:UDP-N-acetylglucosamine 4,6-dehydratase (inverting) [Magnetospirillum sp. SS-4]CAA7619844.1 UDP-N-acetylglucosamine 4,6-dehydratase (inverting) [Magnetospirillum sp. SS-4]